MMLLDDKEIEVAKAEAEKLYWAFKAHPRFEYDKYLLSVQAKKILIKLQAIYNLPNEGMFHNKMGEFIESLLKEVKQ